ncbi:MAG TPA: HD domain-containing protein [Pirellulales bacterium]|nr:HD domain-containing protein [Pirellulales bacterium]
MRNWQDAIAFAARAHAGQLRKDGETPYVAHVYRVMMTVRHVFGCDDEVALCAAALHDTIEDTTTDYDNLLDFGPEVAGAVAALTKDARLPEDERENKYDEVIRAASWQTKLVKLADVYDNLNDAGTSKKPLKAIEKAKRAITCAGHDERLKKAIEAVQRLIEQKSTRA